MDASNRRNDYRVAVPGEFVREAALWFCQEKDHVRLEARELGRPHILYSKLGPGRMILTDLSIRGLGMKLDIPEALQEKLAPRKACFVWLQLWDPSHEDPYGVLSTFTYCQLARVAPSPGGLFLGASFRRFAVGSRLDKTLEFLDAQSCGVTALAHWCDNIARGFRPEPGRACGGLDMDHLLQEIDNAMHSNCETPEERP